MVRRFNSAAAGAMLAVLVALPAHAADLKVVVTSKPIHSLVASVMAGVGNPKLLVEGSASPHTFSLRPSGAAAIQSADVFFRVSGSIEPFSEKISASLPASVQFVTLAETAGFTLLDQRTGATFDDDDDGDDPNAKDGHVWLDPDNGKLMATKIAAVLSAKDPEHASQYATNLTALNGRIDQLTIEIVAKTKPLAGKPFIVFHDGYHYFEHRFGLHAAGSITISPDVQPSAKRLTELRHKITKIGAACVFAEPLFQPKLVAAVTEGTHAKPGTLDAEGIALEPGPELYFTLLRGLATNLAGCLG
jgi:zinc transport system substrate-binding protein